MRVVLVIPWADGPAAMIFSKRQACALLEAGVAVETFFLASRTSPVMLVRERNRFRRLVRDFSPDIVHAQFGTVTALFCATSTGLPLVITFCGSDLNPYPSPNRCRQWVAHFFSQLAALRAHRIICVSKQLQSRLWWRRERAVILPFGPDTASFYPGPQDEARQRLGWSQRQYVVLFNGGRSRQVKRLDLAQAAVEHARQGNADIRLEVLRGETAQELVPEMMRAADCLLLTSDWEGSPTVIQEAMACNLPVVSVDVGDVLEMLSGVVPSVVVPRDPTAIGAAVARVVALRQRSNGAEKARSISVSRIAFRLIQLYSELLGV
jgi:teichuronic acid biosynthesis glycosyltransferase TuaC